MMHKILIAGETHDFRVEEDASEHPLDWIHATHPEDLNAATLPQFSWMLVSLDDVMDATSPWRDVLYNLKNTIVLFHGAFLTKEACLILGEAIQRCGFFVPDNTLHTIPLSRIVANPELFSEVYMNNGLVVDFNMRNVLLDGQDQLLTPMEFDLLRYLIRHPNQALSRDTLIQGVWGYSFLGDSRTIDTHIKSLRKKLGSHRRLVKTVWGSGYRFNVC